MAKTLQQIFVANKQVVRSSDSVNGTTLAPAFQMTNEFHIGDQVYDHLNLRLYGNISSVTGGGNVNPDGLLQFIRAIYFSTPLHQNIIENVDGILMADMLHIRNRAKLVRQDPANTKKGGTEKLEAYLRIPFVDNEMFSGKDTGLDMFQAGGKPTLQLNLGAYNPDIVTGPVPAGDGLQALNLEADVVMDPGPVESADLPSEFMQYYGKLAFPVTATGTSVRIDIAFGDRVYKRVFVSQREGTNGVRRPNDIIGVNETDRIFLKVNSNIIHRDKISWLGLQRKNEYDYKIPLMPTGLAVFDFVPTILGGIDSLSGRLGGVAGAKVVDALNVSTKFQGSVVLEMDVTAGNSPNPQIVIGYDAMKFIPLGARRAAPPAAGPNKG